MLKVEKRFFMFAGIAGIFVPSPFGIQVTQSALRRIEINVKIILNRRHCRHRHNACVCARALVKRSDDSSETTRPLCAAVMATLRWCGHIYLCIISGMSKITEYGDKV